MALKNFLNKLEGLWPWAETELEKAAVLAPEVLPYINQAGLIANQIDPHGIETVVFNAIKAAFPHLFDGSIKTPDEVKLYTLGVATTLVQQHFAGVSTSVARLAVQAAYTSNNVPQAPKTA